MTPGVQFVAATTSERFGFRSQESYPHHGGPQPRTATATKAKTIPFREQTKRDQKATPDCAVPCVFLFHAHHVLNRGITSTMRRKRENVGLVSSLDTVTRCHATRSRPPSLLVA